MMKFTTYLLGTILSISLLLSPASAKLMKEQPGLSANSATNQTVTLKENDKECGDNLERCIEQTHEDGA